MSTHAARRPLSRRILKPVAIAAVVLLGGLGMTEGGRLSPAQAASTLSCDQNTIYSIDTNGNMQSIDVGSTTATNITTLTGANNALAITANGTAAYGTTNSATAPTGGSVSRYDAVSGNITSYPATVPQRALRGAVNPQTQIYYYAQGAVSNPAVYAFDTANNTAIGMVGHLTDVVVNDAATQGNGDFAFSTSGTLFVASGAQVLRSNTVLPTTAGDVAIHTSQVTALPDRTNTPGIAFSTNGYLYVSSAKNLIKIDPSSGQQVSSTAIANGNQPTDLASCNYADTIQAQASVDQRWQSGDQFALKIDGDNIQYGNTATTAGTGPGLQPETAGSSLIVAGNSYTATETASGSTAVDPNTGDFVDYDTTYRCVDASTGNTLPNGQGSGRTASITLAKAAKDVDVSCVFTNTLKSVHASAQPDSYKTATGTPVTVDGTSSDPVILANDKGTGISIVSSTDPSHGTVSLDRATGHFTYTPADGFTGKDTFTYTVRDTSGQTSTATVAIVVGPSVTDDTAATTTNTALVADAQHGVLANDGGDALTAALASGPQHGQLTLNTDGSYTYTPDSGYSGPDSFTYTATDSAGQRGTGTVTLTVAPTAGADDLGSVTYGQTTTFPVSVLLGNDRGTGLTVTSISAATSGTVTLSSDGTQFTYVPARGTSGPASFTYTVTDSSQQTAQATASLIVAPIANPDTLPSVTAGSAAAFTTDSSVLLGNDRGSGLTITAVRAAVHGSVSLSSDGATVTFTPDSGYSGGASFDYVLSDSSGDTASTTARFTITPAVSATSTTAISGTPDSVDKEHGVLSDSEGTDLTASVADGDGPSHGDLSMNPDGSYVYTPSASFSGEDSFTYTATDGTTSMTGTVTITVVPAAIDDALSPSTFSPSAGRLSILPGATLLANDHGVPGELAIASVSTPEHGIARLNSDGTVSYRPSAGWSGPDSFTYTVIDKAGNVSAPATVTFTVTPVAVDDALPEKAVSGSSTVIPASDFLGNDRGTGLVLTGASDPSAGTVTFDKQAGTVTYTPMPNFSGSFTFDYTIGDATGQTSGAKATIVVAPAAGDLVTTVAAGTVDQVGAADGLLSQTSGSSVTLVGTTDPQHGTLAVDPSRDGSYTYTPGSTFSGTDSFTYTVKDGSGTKSTGTVSVTVTPVAKDDVVSALAGTPLAIATADLLANDRGTGLGSFTFTAPVATTSTASPGTLTSDGNGTLTYTPADGFSGKATFTYTVEDTEHQASTATVTITVAPVAKNDAYTATAATPLTVAKGDGLTVNDSGSGLTTTLAATPAHGTVTVNGDGSFTYTPAPGYSGPDSFTYTLTDAAKTPTTATVAITVNPLAANDSYRTPAGTRISSDAPGILGNDRGQSITVTGVGTKGLPGSVVTTPHGTVTVSADGTFDYTPAIGFSGTESFPYAIADKDGDSVTATITVTVTPVAVDDRFSTDADTALPISVIALTGNDRGTGLGVTAGTTTAKGGSLVKQSDGSFVFQPKAGFSGTDSFVYTLTDGSGQTTTALVRIVVGDRAANYESTTNAGTGYSTDAAKGLLLDTVGSNLTATLDAPPTHGKVTVARDGSYTYKPAPDYSGLDSFTYTITDDAGQIRTGTVTIRVLPLVANDVMKTSAGTKIVIGGKRGLLGNDWGSKLSVTSTTRPDHGGLTTVSPTGLMTYTPAAGFSGVETFTYTVVDADGFACQDPAVVIITVTPRATPDSGATTAGRTLTVAAGKGLLSDDSGSRLTAALKSAPRHGSVTVNRDGSYSYVPKAGFTGTDSFTYTATDRNGFTTTAKATITVSPGAHAVNDAVEGKPNVKATIDLLANDEATSGATFDPSTIGLIDPATGKATDTVALDGKGTFRVSGSVVSFTPEHNFHGVAAVHYRVTDTDAVTVAAIIRVTYPTVVAAAIRAAATPVAASVVSALAFTGSAGTGVAIGIGLLSMIAGLGLLVGRQLKRPAPGPRRTGL
ncbi:MULTISPECIES: S-layer family protein [unclassified Frondihabitans]|uniref:beta strand repeat-containing protein n=1 Tax=unclassified Frondihabitans TaxID=2626248 RepID=UPI000F4EB216|nr:MULTISPECIES: Ig-like domain-containing protein [unclassified Frondihabitans]RPE78520.1 VCBS repeat-containing protein/CshA-type fibril repeat protein [Frondihabitans sp. PhB153]RPF08801.1 VCBS repeat-containing protein/CshA-type fibril repeat protein [Frondihabitans sp. PhB161]